MRTFSQNLRDSSSLTPVEWVPRTGFIEGAALILGAISSGMLSSAFIATLTPALLSIGVSLTPGSRLMQRPSR
jgi:hypothetical protein